MDAYLHLQAVYLLTVTQGISLFVYSSSTAAVGPSGYNLHCTRNRSGHFQGRGTFFHVSLYKACVKKHAERKGTCTCFIKYFKCPARELCSLISCQPAHIAAHRMSRSVHRSFITIQDARPARFQHVVTPNWLSEARHF